MIEAELEIRRAAPQDAEMLTQLVRTSRAYEGQYRSMVAGYTVSADHIARHQVWVADVQGQVWGFYQLLLEPEPELDLMFVADAAQGFGVGSALFRHMCATARLCGAASVMIISHPPASPFYERMGARLAGICPAGSGALWPRPIYRMAVSQEATVQ
jgi:GNAT superfamily N-acetyltransferase